MDGTKKAEARWADQETLSLVRPEVRAILESSQAFHKLPSEDQKKLAGAMVEVSSYMTNPDGLARLRRRAPRRLRALRERTSSPAPSKQVCSSLAS